jgi:hypothetical protein
VQSLAGAGVGLAAILVVPGALALAAARVRISLVEVVALAPTVTIGALWVGAEVADVVGIGFGWPVYAAVTVALAALAVWRWWVPQDPFVVDIEAVPAAASAPATGDGRVRRLQWGRRAGPAGLLALVLLVGAIGVGGATWVRGVRGHDTTPPNYDASQHGLFVTRIDRASSIDTAEVVVSDTRGDSAAANYYPLAMHAVVAVAAEVTGADVADLLTALVIVMGAVVLPCGLYALTRRVVPDVPLAAGFAALLASLFSVYPYKPIGWGGLTLIVGVALVPGVIVLVDRLIRRPLTWAGGALGALCVMAVLAQHNSQMPMLGFLIAVLLLEAAALARSWRVLGEGIVRAAVLGAGALLLFVPTLLSFAGGVSERSEFRDTELVPLNFVLGELVTLRAYAPSSQGWLMVLALLGAGVLIWRHQPAWVAAGVATFSLVVIAAVSAHEIAEALTVAWYRQPERIAYYLVYFIPVLAGIAVGVAAAALASAAARLPAARTWGLPVAAVLAVGLIAVVGGVSAVRVNRKWVTTAYTEYAPVGPAQVAAFRWLEDRTDGRGLVLSETSSDGSVWMYAFTDANPLFGAYPQKKSEFADRSVRDRDYLRDHITELGRNPKVARLLKRYGIRYLYFGEATYRGAPHTWNLAQLRDLPGLTEVFTRGGSHVFRVESPS